MPIKPLTFKGDPRKKSSKKRKADTDTATATESITTLTPSNAQPHPQDPNSDQPQDTDQDSTWLSADTPTDISGPLLLVLPTQPSPSALACDDLGSVFVSPLQNVVREAGVSVSLMAQTSEPDDVRQVWVGTRVGGDGATGKRDEEQNREVLVSFKGVNGRYLGCSGLGGGTLKAEAVAVGTEETFRVSVPGGDDHGGGGDGGGFLVGTTAGSEVEGFEEKKRYISVHRNERTGWDVTAKALDASTSTESSSTLYIRMQARFKPHFKAHKEMKAKERISRRELEAAVGRRLDEDEVKRLKRARRHGSYHEEVLDVRVKGKHDKFAC